MNVIMNVCAEFHVKPNQSTVFEHGGGSCLSLGYMTQCCSGLHTKRSVPACVQDFYARR